MILMILIIIIVMVILLIFTFFFFVMPFCGDIIEHKLIVSRERKKWKEK